MKQRQLLTLLILVTLAGACSRPKQQEARAKPAAAAAAQPANAPAAGRIEVVDAEGRPVFTLEPASSGYHVQASGRLLAKVKVGDDHVKLEDPSGRVLLRLKRKEGKGKAEDASGTVMFSIKRQSSKQADYKLENPAGETLFRFKREAWGYKVSDAEHETLYKLRIASLRFAAGRVTAEDGQGRALLEVRGTRDALAASAAALDRFDVGRRAALLVYLAHFEGSEE